MTATITDNTKNPVIVFSGQTVTPFTPVSVSDPLVVTPPTNTLSGGGAGSLVIALTPSTGNVLTSLGTISDPGIDPGTFDASSESFTQLTFGGPTVPSALGPQPTLQSLAYTAPVLANGQSAIVDATISYNPTGAAKVTDPTSILLEIVTAPAIVGTLAIQELASGKTGTPFGATTIIDNDFSGDANLDATITVTDNGAVTDADGVLSGPGVTKAGTGLYTVTNRSVIGLLTALHNLDFTPVSVAAGASQTTNFSLAVTDTGANLTSTDRSMVITTGPVMPPPVPPNAPVPPTIVQTASPSPTTSATFAGANGIVADLSARTVLAGATTIALAAGITSLTGSRADDTFIAAPGDGSWTINGGGGDTLVIDGAGYGQAQITGSLGGTVNIALSGTTINATGIEQISFIDGAITTDPNSAGAEVQRLYQAALGRVADAPGLASWVQAFGQGDSLTTIAQGFLGSAEFQARFPGDRDPTTFVTQLYQNVLGRVPDAAGLANWVGALTSGTQTQAQLLVDFAQSAENQKNTAPFLTAGLYVPNENAANIARLYYGALDRAPDLTGLTGWTNALQNGGMSLAQAAAGFVASPEFQTDYGNLGNQAFVDLLYQNVLGRVADAVGEASWTNALYSGAVSRAGALLGFTQSPEDIARLAPVIENGGIKYV